MTIQVPLPYPTLHAVIITSFGDPILTHGPIQLNVKYMFILVKESLYFIQEPIMEKQVVV